MKTWGKHLMALLMGLVLAMAWASPARADEVDISYLTDPGVTLCYLPHPKYSWDNHYDFLIPSGKVTKVKVSNKKVLGVTRKNADGKHYLVLVPKKVGSTKISYVYQGKSYTTTVINKKYVNPCKKVMLDSTNVAKKFDRVQDIVVKRTAKRRIKIVPKAGWKITGIYCLGASGATRQLKNGGKIPAKCDFVYVNLLNSSENLAISININGR